MPRVTQKEIADELGITKAAVSLALRDSHRISENLRKKVRETADRLGYVPDPELAKIAAARWKNHRASEGSRIAFVVDRSLERKGHDDKLTNRLKIVGEETLRIYGYGSELCVLKPKEDLQKAFTYIVNRGFAGVVLFPVFREDFFEHYPYEILPTVSVANGFIDPPVDAVKTNFTESIRCSSHYLI